MLFPLSLPDPVVALTSNLLGVLQTADRATALRFSSALVRNAPDVLRARNLSPVDRAFKVDARARFRLFGAEVEVCGEDFPLAREMYCRRVYFACPQVTLTAGSTVVDLGANVGLFSLLAARCGCRVVAVEAQRGFIAEISSRLRRNHCEDRVAIECALVGAGHGAFADSTVMESATHFEPGQATPHLSMDTLMARHQLEQIDFLKVDIEGAEFGLFAEPAPWMRRVRCIAMEVHPEFGRVDALERVLRAAGMQTMRADDRLRWNAPITDRAGYLYGFQPR